MSGIPSKSIRVKIWMILLACATRFLSPGFDPGLQAAETPPESVQSVSVPAGAQPAPSALDNTAPAPIEVQGETGAVDDGAEEGVQEIPAIADPFRPLNVAAFHVNDKLYLWILDPLSRGYASVLPAPVRTGIGNVYDNIRSPARVINHLLQFRFKAAGSELGRFLLNSTFGVAGIFDAAGYALDMKKQEADFGQTLGCSGLGQGFYIVWPILGPSSLRETVGLAGDFLMSPLTYVSKADLSVEGKAALSVHEKVNDTSFRIGDYESFKRSAIDPYTAMRDAFVQHRNAKVNQCRTDR